ncbi:hypothetical protein [Streptomyces sp. NPDC090053]|uniref:hypothetical protein n=1 Tax=Streptomyces sp. NPDC090053 TaxID=3365932 RepID=UPI003805F25C
MGAIGQRYTESRWSLQFNGQRSTADDPSIDSPAACVSRFCELTNRKGRAEREVTTTATFIGIDQWIIKTLDLFFNLLLAHEADESYWTTPRIDVAFDAAFLRYMGA